MSMIWNKVNVPLFYLANVLCKNSVINTIQAWKMEIVVHRMTTAEPGFSGTVLYCHPVLSNWLLKFWICLPLITVIFITVCRYCFVTVTLYWHNGLFLLFSTCIEWSLKADHSSKTDNRWNNFQSMSLSQNQSKQY